VQNVRTFRLHSLKPNKRTWNVTQSFGILLLTEVDNDSISTLVSSLKVTGGECFVHLIMKPEEALVSESVVWKTDVISANKVVETNGI